MAPGKLNNPACKLHVKDIGSIKREGKSAKFLIEFIYMGTHEFRYVSSRTVVKMKMFIGWRPCNNNNNNCNNYIAPSKACGFPKMYIQNCKELYDTVNEN